MAHFIKFPYTDKILRHIFVQYFSFEQHEENLESWKSLIKQCC